MKTILKDSLYTVVRGKVLRTRQLTELEKLFEIALPEGRSLDHEPGQFVQVSIFGVGEAPVSICSSPTKRDSLEITVRKVGRLTGALHMLEPGDEVGIRGPYGKGFPITLMEGNDILIVGGGLGIVPLRSLIYYIIDNKREFGKVYILLGSRTPKDILFGDEVEQWQERVDVNFSCTVDRVDEDWKGNIGLITSLIPGVNLDPHLTFAAVVGPPVMYKFVIKELQKKQIPDRQILVSLERRMKCGLGKCGHCQIEHLYCCQDGPVFTYEQIKDLEGAI
jgi:sulfite reductase subunit B